MIYAKFSNRFKLPAAVFLAATALILCPVPASAQDSGYTPPPMFDDMTPPMVRPEAKDGYIVTPKVSPQPVEQRPQQARPPVITPRVSVDPVAPAVPVPPGAPSSATPPKMMKPIIEGEKASSPAPAVKAGPVTPEVKTPVPPQKPSAQNVEQVKPVAVPRAKPVAAPEKAETSNASKGNTVTKAPVSSEERTSPVKRDPSVSAIQGPKTMPALPAQSVDKQALPDAASQSADGGETILERHQKEAKANRGEEIKPVVPAPKAGVAPASFDRGENDALKKSIAFEPGQIGLKPDVADPIAAGVSKELDDDARKAWRVQIKAYATPHGTGLSSDRRIALSRALSLRSTLITQGIPASKIDVMAEGLEAENGKPGDRIDLYLYGPKQR